MDSENSQQLLDTLVERWSVPEETVLSDEGLLAALTARVQEMIERTPSKLATAMYTLDVSEEKFEAASQLPDLEDQALAIAELILHRERQKAESWRQYQAMKGTAVRYRGESLDAPGD